MRTLLTLLVLILPTSLLWGQKDLFDSGLNVGFHYYHPGEYFEFSDMEAKQYLEEKFSRQTIGFGSQFGHWVYFNDINLGEKFRIGLDIAYFRLSFLSADYEFESVYDFDGSPYRERAQFLFLGTEIGPLVAFQVAEDMGLSLGCRFGPQIAIGINSPFGGLLTEQIGLRFRAVPAFRYQYKMFFTGVDASFGELGNTSTATGFTAWRLSLGIKF
ncbi:hypothetical protein KFE98_05190 [bacterium SCSIO 12741]|nr:hypothetical protein KFE98_05190 [bacterium SCSIO 12741]